MAMREFLASAGSFALDRGMNMIRFNVGPGAPSDGIFSDLRFLPTDGIVNEIEKKESFWRSLINGIGESKTILLQIDQGIDPSNRDIWREFVDLSKKHAQSELNQIIKNAGRRMRDHSGEVFSFVNEVCSQALFHHNNEEDWFTYMRSMMSVLSVNQMTLRAGRVLQIFDQAAHHIKDSRFLTELRQDWEEIQREKEESGTKSGLAGALERHADNRKVRDDEIKFWKPWTWF